MRPMGFEPARLRVRPMGFEPARAPTELDQPPSYFKPLYLATHQKKKIKYHMRPQGFEPARP